MAQTLNKTSCSAFANNDSLAYCSSDGVLHVWDVQTGTQKQQYLPSSHLTASFTCLSWKISSQKHKEELPSPKKKKAKQPRQVVENVEYIALGTAVGDVVLYNPFNGQLVSKHNGGHSDRVNCISWGKENIFYSCSNDQHIVEWHTGNSNHKRKWKAEKREVYSVAVGPYYKTILSAGKAIKLWDLKTKELLRRFAGHTTPVFSLSFVNNPAISAKLDASPLDIVNGLYFLSSALEDRTLSAWQLKSIKHKKTAVCSFALPSEPCIFDLFHPASKDQPFHLLVVTEDSEIVVFVHTLNGSLKKPLIPQRTIKIVTEDASPLNIICATFNKNTDSPIITIAYGSDIRVAFEHVNLKENSNSDIVLIRKDPTKSEILMEGDKVKLRQPIVKKEVATLAPGAIGHSGEKGGKKRKKHASIGESQLTMEERLTALSVETKTNENQTPRADSFSILLSQGLHSRDRDVLNQVLQHGNETLIRNTVSQLPINYVIPLVKELTERMQGSPDKCLIFVMWMRETLSHHTSYLMTFPDIVPLLSRLYQLMNVRTETQVRLSRLEGKLDLIMSQVTNRKKESHEGASEQNEAMFVFEEDSSDEHDEMEGITIDHPDSFDEWDDFSDNVDKPDEDSRKELSDLIIDEDIEC